MYAAQAGASALGTLCIIGCRGRCYLEALQGSGFWNAVQRERRQGVGWDSQSLLTVEPATVGMHLAYCSPVRLYVVSSSPNEGIGILP